MSGSHSATSTICAAICIHYNFNSSALPVIQIPSPTRPTVSSGALCTFGQGYEVEDQQGGRRRGESQTSSSVASTTRDGILACRIFRCPLGCHLSTSSTNILPSTWPRPVAATQTARPRPSRASRWLHPTKHSATSSCQMPGTTLLTSTSPSTITSTASLPATSSSTGSCPSSCSQAARASPRPTIPTAATRTASTTSPLSSVTTNLLRGTSSCCGKC